VSVELFPFRGEPAISIREVHGLKGTEALFISYSITTDVIDNFVGVSTILFVSTNLTNRLEQMGVSAYVLKRSEASTHRRRIPLTRNGTKSVDLLELKQLRLHLNGRCLEVNISIAKRVADSFA
jgi:hypothetical protein